MQTGSTKNSSIARVFVALLSLAAFAPGIQAAHSQNAYTSSSIGYQSHRSSGENRYGRHRRVNNQVIVTIPMNGVYFNHRKTLKLKSLVKDYSQFRARDYTLERVVLNAAFRQAAHHRYERESYAYLKTKRLVSERRHIPYTRNHHQYPRVSLTVHQSVSADNWKLYIGPNVKIDSITLVLNRKSRGHYQTTSFHGSDKYGFDERHHWSEFANIRTRRENRRDKQLRIPTGASHIKLVGERRDTDILYAWVSYSNGRIQRLPGLQGTLRYGQSLKAPIRPGNHQDVQATLHLVFKPHHRGHRSNMSVQSA